MTIQPPKLNAGDRAIIVSPSGYVDSKYIYDAKNVLENWGLSVSVAKHAEEKYGRYAGCTSNRLFDLQNALDDDEIKLIFCSRGGYGAVQLLEQLNFDGIRENPKWLVGYSDITALHLALMQAGIMSIHAPMARHLSEDAGDDASSLLKQSLFEQPTSYALDNHVLNKHGETEGTVFGGNLAVLGGLIGTSYMKIPENGILFIEDIAESPYKIDRMMWNLRLSGILQSLSGLIIGQFSECEEDPLMQISIYESILNMVSEYKYPVVFDFPVGHIKKNYPLVQGGRYILEVNTDKTSLRFRSNNPH